MKTCLAWGKTLADQRYFIYKQVEAGIKPKKLS